MAGKDKYKRAFPRKKCPSLFVRSLLGAMPYVRAPRRGIILLPSVSAV